jgi:hypothetical protein
MLICVNIAVLRFSPATELKKSDELFFLFNVFLFNIRHLTFKTLNTTKPLNHKNTCILTPGALVYLWQFKLGTIMNEN